MSALRPVDVRQVRRNFSARAADYDCHAGVQQEVAARLLALLLADGPAPGAVLEVGAGTGWLAERLAAAWPQARLVLSDLAHGMTRQAARRVPGAQAVDADAQALPLASGRFSLVLSSSVYQWVNDLPRAFAESARVLAAGGRFAFALFGERTLWELREAHRQAALEKGGNSPSHVQQFPAAAEIRQALAAAGLVEVRLEAEERVEWHPGVPALLASLKAIGARNAACDRPAGLAPRRVVQRMLALYGERHCPEKGVPATWHVLYGLARKPQ